jgi:hypothetical protein
MTKCNTQKGRCTKGGKNDNENILKGGGIKTIFMIPVSDWPHDAHLGCQCSLLPRR